MLGKQLFSYYSQLLYQVRRSNLFPLSHFFHVAKTIGFEDQNRYIPFYSRGKTCPGYSYDVLKTKLNVSISFLQWLLY